VISTTGSGCQRIGTNTPHRRWFFRPGNAGSSTCGRAANARDKTSGVIAE